MEVIWIILVLIVLIFFPVYKESDIKWEYRKPRDTTRIANRMPRGKRLRKIWRSGFSYLCFKIRRIFK